MDRGPKYLSEEEELFHKLMRRKWALLLLSILVLIVGLSCFGICIWIRFDLDFREWVWAMDWYSYWYCVYVIMVAMVFVVCNSILAAYGILAESRAALFWTQILYIVQIILEFIGAICICTFGVEESEKLTEQLRENSEWDANGTRILMQMQEYIGCCGANGSEDYNDAFKPVPEQCRDRVTGIEFRYGCAQQMAWWLEPWSCALAGICLILMLVHVAQMAVTSRLSKRMRDYHRAYNNNNYDHDGHGDHQYYD